MKSLDDVVTETEHMGEGGDGKGDYFKPERAILTSQVSMMRVRFVGGWFEFFESWCEQQPGPGIVQGVGSPRRIVSEGYYKDDSGDWKHRCPYSKALWDARDSGDDVRAKQGEDWKMQRFFAMFVVPLDMATGVPDEWCVEKSQAKLLTTHKSTFGIKQTLFKAIGDAMRVRRAIHPDAVLSNTDIIVTRTGSGLGTKYGAQAHDAIGGGDYSGFATYTEEQIAPLTPVNKIQEFTGWDLGANNQTPASAPVTPSVADTTPMVAQGSTTVAPAVAAAPAAPQVASHQPAASAPPAAATVESPAAVSNAPATEVVPKPCPRCGNMVNISAELRGQTVTCPHCSQQFDTVPF